MVGNGGVLGDVVEVGVGAIVGVGVIALTGEGKTTPKNSVKKIMRGSFFT
jgi:hypothetical protein